MDSERTLEEEAVGPGAAGCTRERGTGGDAEIAVREPADGAHLWRRAQAQAAGHAWAPSHLLEVGRFERLLQIPAGQPDESV